MIFFEDFIAETFKEFYNLLDVLSLFDVFCKDENYSHETYGLKPPHCLSKSE